MTKQEGELLFSVLSYYVKSDDNYKNNLNVELFSDNSVRLTNKLNNKSETITSFAQVRPAVTQIVNFGPLRVLSKAGGNLKDWARGTLGGDAGRATNVKKGLMLKRLVDLLEDFTKQKSEFIEKFRDLVPQIKSVSQSAGSYGGQLLHRMEANQRKAVEYAGKIKKMTAYKSWEHDNDIRREKAKYDEERLNKFDKKKKAKESSKEKVESIEKDLNDIRDKYKKDIDECITKLNLDSSIARDLMTKDFDDVISELKKSKDSKERKMADSLENYKNKDALKDDRDEYKKLKDELKSAKKADSRTDDLTDYEKEEEEDIKRTNRINERSK